MSCKDCQFCHLVIICVFYTQKIVIFSFTSKMSRGTSCSCEFSSIQWLRYRNGNLELRKSKFQSLYCHVKHTKTAKGVSFFSLIFHMILVSNYLTCLHLECQCFLEISTYLGCCKMITALNKNALRICVFKV